LKNLARRRIESQHPTAKTKVESATPKERDE
jgi:hypothetical protein